MGIAISQVLASFEPYFYARSIARGTDFTPTDPKNVSTGT